MSGLRCARVAAFAAAGWLAAAFAWGQTSQPTPIPPSGDPDALATMVVYNGTDPNSEALAHFYAEKRNIPKNHIVGLACPLNEEITREEYDNTIADPIRKVLVARGWMTTSLANSGGEVHVEENQIRYIALMRGVPLKIASVKNYPGDRTAGRGQLADHNEAAVDSELASLCLFTTNISGALTNPYYKSFTGIRDANVPALMLVCRLDGPSVEVVRRMITDSIEVEKEGLWGFCYLDARNLPG